MLKHSRNVNSPISIFLLFPSSFGESDVEIIYSSVVVWKCTERVNIKWPETKHTLHLTPCVFLDIKWIYLLSWYDMFHFEFGHILLFLSNYHLLLFSNRVTEKPRKLHTAHQLKCFNVKTFLGVVSLLSVSFITGVFVFAALLSSFIYLLCSNF